MIRPLTPLRALTGMLCVLLLTLLIACDSNTAPPTPIAASPTTAPTSAPAPSDTPVAATPTAAPASATTLPSDTPAAPPATVTSAPTSAPTETSAPPTETLAPATDTALPATDTAVPATATRRPATDTAVPATSVPTERAGPAEATETAPAEATETPVDSASNTPGPPPATPEGGFPTPAVPAGKVPGDMSQIERIAPGKKRIAITFDAGAGVGYVPSILTTLARYNTHITFFITGQWAEQNPNQLRAIVAAGDEIGNHTYSHPSFPTLNDAQMKAELNKCESIIQAETGISTKPYWRPPFGDETGHVLNVAQSLGYRSIYWTWDSLDSVGKPKSKDFLVQRVLKASVKLDGAIILMHVGNETSAEALPEILDGLTSQGLRVVTISELLAP